MKLSSEAKWMTGAFSLAMLLTGFSSFISYQNTAQLMENTHRVEHTRIVLTGLTDIVATMLNADTERRNYLQFREKEDLDDYNTAIQTLDNHIHQLRLERLDDPAQQQRLTVLESLVTQWRSSLDQPLRSAQRNQASVLTSDTLRNQNQQLRTEIQQMIDEMQTSETDRLQQWIKQVQKNTHYQILTEISSTILSFSILVGTVGLLHRQMIKRQQADIKRQQAESHQRTLAQEKELGELKLQFFSMVSHEFRTPLSLILGSAQLLTTGDDYNWLSEQKRNNLERIQSAARIMNQLLTDLLTITRADAGKLEFSPKLMDVESFCLNLIEDFKSLSEPSCNIEFVSLKYCPAAFLDEKLLYSILSNLLSNAIKYSPEGGVIQFKLDCTSQAIIFEIKDQGIGIPVETQQKLYEPFHRASNVGMISGTGLGLAVVKKCLDLHQGKIFVESNIGVGTMVMIHIPLMFKPAKN